MTLSEFATLAGVVAAVFKCLALLAATGFFIWDIRRMSRGW